MCTGQDISHREPLYSSSLFENHPPLLKLQRTSRFSTRPPPTGGGLSPTRRGPGSFPSDPPLVQIPSRTDAKRDDLAIISFCVGARDRIWTLYLKNREGSGWSSSWRRKGRN